MLLTSIVDTPALILDLTRFEANVSRMAQSARAMGVALRPHAKCLKSAKLSSMQVLAGAVGICVAKLHEAEAIVHAGGPTNILITNQIVTKQKIIRLAALSKSCEWLGVCVDNPTNFDMLQVFNYERCLIE